jgi:hypothetical protein
LIICGAIFAAASLARSQNVCFIDAIEVPEIKGHVLLEVSQKTVPLSDTTLEVTPDDGSKTIIAKTASDKDGAFVIRGVKPGCYSVTARHVGLPEFTAYVKVESSDAKLTDVPEIRFILRNNPSQVSGGANAERAFPGADQLLLLAMYTDNIGMFWPAGRTLYAVVTKDGHMTYTDIVGKELIEKSRDLSPAELAKLRSVLEASNVTNLSGNLVAARDRGQDYATRLEVKIIREQQLQEFILINYWPSAKRDYPPATKDLLCLVDELRRSSYRLTQACN